MIDNHDKPLVSIIVPVYQVEEYLDDCMDSLLKQTYQNIEIILVDDGSTDHCPQMCDEYRLKYSQVKVIHQSNMGLPAARNSGLAIAVGEWILFVDSDDWLSYDAIEKVMTVHDSSLDLIFFNFTREMNYQPTILSSGTIPAFREINKKDFDQLVQDAFSPSHHRYKAFKQGKVTAWSKLYNHKFLSENGLLFFPEVKIHEDIPYAVSVFMKANKGMYIDCAIYHYRCRSGSILTTYRPDYEEQLVPLIKKMMELSTQFQDIDLGKTLLYERLMALFLFIVRGKYCNSNNSQSYIQRRKNYMALRNGSMYKNAIENVRVSNFTLIKGAAVFCVKRNWFFLLNLYYRVFIKCFKVIG